MADTPCQEIISSIISGQIARMDEINRKVYGLRRLAELIEEAANPLTLMPNINDLVPLNQIDVQSYENLRMACPLLNLPSAVEGLDKLKADLFRSYNDLIQRLNLHPFNQLTKLVDTLDRLISQYGIDYACVLGYLQCARISCAPGEFSDTLNRNATVVEDYQKNALNTTAAVLSDRAQVKVSELNSAIAQLRTLTQ